MNKPKELKELCEQLNSLNDLHYYFNNLLELIKADKKNKTINNKIYPIELIQNELNISIIDNNLEVLEITLEEITQDIKDLKTYSILNYVKLGNINLSKILDKLETDKNSNKNINESEIDTDV